MSDVEVITLVVKMPQIGFRCIPTTAPALCNSWLRRLRSVTTSAGSFAIMRLGQWGFADISFKRQFVATSDLLKDGSVGACSQNKVIAYQSGSEFEVIKVLTIYSIILPPTCLGL